MQRLKQQAAETREASWLKEVQAAKKGLASKRRATSVTTVGSRPAAGAGRPAEPERQERRPVEDAPAEEACETRRLDGRCERIFGNGRREVEFSNGLKKVMWPDGQTSVMFQNGDLKEIRPDGVVVCLAF